MTKKPASDQSRNINPKTMKAVICPAYGSPDVMTLAEVPQPEPRPNEVRLKVMAAAVNAGDWHLMRGTPFLVRFMYGLLKPKFPILGSDVAGIVEKTGSEVTLFKPGDAVMGDLSECGFGAFAEYVCVPEGILAPKSENLTFGEAAAFPASGVTALQALRDKGKLVAGKTVLINGASGGVGTFAVQIAKALGAHVTAVCSTSKVESVLAIGADRVIDYTREDFTKNQNQYDLILGVNGYHPLADYKRCLTPDGIYVMVGGTSKQLTEAMVYAPFYSEKNGRKLGNLMMKPNRDDILFLVSLAEKGTLRPVIDRTYNLAEVPAAIRCLEEGRAAGKVVIHVG